MAEMMKNEGEILAIDKYEVKLSFIKGACDRLGLRNVKLAAVDASTLESEQADKVLLDAPCSGLGVLAKKPDIKWKRDITDIIKMSKMQKELLENAARLVKPGGILVYSTCTIEPEENLEVVNRFLSAHPEFVAEDARQFVSPSVVSAQGAVETFPHMHGVDGSFAVRMAKKTGGPA
jgi:16S rRNA (cytosine967-C5)-methyltransferase